MNSSLRSRLTEVRIDDVYYTQPVHEFNYFDIAVFFSNATTPYSYLGLCKAVLLIEGGGNYHKPDYFRTLFCLDVRAAHEFNLCFFISATSFITGEENKQKKKRKKSNEKKTFCSTSTFTR